MSAKTGSTKKDEKVNPDDRLALLQLEIKKLREEMDRKKPKQKTLNQKKKSIKKSKVMTTLKSENNDLYKIIEPKIDESDERGLKSLYGLVKNYFYSDIATTKWMLNDGATSEIESNWKTQKEYFKNLKENFDINNPEHQKLVSEFYNDVLPEFRPYAYYEKRNGEKQQVPTRQPPK